MDDKLQRAMDRSKRHQQPSSCFCNHELYQTDSNKPALLTFSEVNTFLHEFGHALHGIFANTRFKSMSGTNVYWDFVELPSQIMENFAIEKDFLNTFARHYQTNESIPEELLQRIIDASNFNVAYACLRQISFGLLDMAWYTRIRRSTVMFVNMNVKHGNARNYYLR